MKHIAKIHVEFFKLSQDDMSGTVHKEREKRLTLSEKPPEIDDVKPTLIQQGILREIRDDKDDMITYARVRMMKEDGKDPVYSLGIKNFPLDQEAETEISKAMFDSYYPDNLDKPQEKNRYPLSNGWEVDIVEGDEEGIYAEYEHKAKEKVDIPSHWKVKEE